MVLRLPAVKRRANLPVDGKELLFDRHPLSTGFDKQGRHGFRFSGRSVIAVGRPTITGFQEALALACEFHESSPHWVGGLVAYGEGREDWKEKLSQAMSVTKLARHTLQNLGYVYRHTTEAVRALAPSPAHAAEVATLPEGEQAALMREARDGEFTVRELRRAVQARTRRRVLDGHAATMHTVDVTVQVTVEAPNETRAQDVAWDLVKHALTGERTAKVIAARARSDLK